MKVRINERQLHNIICECVRKELLKELDDDYYEYPDTPSVYAYIDFDDDILPHLDSLSDKYPVFDEYGDYNEEWLKSITDIIGNEWRVEYDYEDGEKATYDHPGSPAEITGVRDDGGIFRKLMNIPDVTLRKYLEKIFDDVIEMKEEDAEVDY